MDKVKVKSDSPTNDVKIFERNFFLLTNVKVFILYVSLFRIVVKFLVKSKYTFFSANHW